MDLMTHFALSLFPLEIVTTGSPIRYLPGSNCNRTAVVSSTQSVTRSLCYSLLAILLHNVPESQYLEHISIRCNSLIPSNGQRLHRLQAYRSSGGVPATKVRSDFSTSAVKADHIGKEQTFEMVGTVLFYSPSRVTVDCCAFWRCQHLA
jgi:hypothetical protein